VVRVRASTNMRSLKRLTASSLEEEARLSDEVLEDSQTYLPKPRSSIQRFRADSAPFESNCLLPFKRSGFTTFAQNSRR
jgi:hypothetical protein